MRSIMKKYIIMLFAGMLFASCMNEFDTPEVSTDIFTADTIAPANTTISTLRSKYASVTNNSSYQQITNDVIIEGVVVANDLSGNIYQTVYIQELDSNGDMNTTNGGISVGIKGYGALYALFPVGQKIRINLKGLFIGGYYKLPKIGQPYVNINGALRMGPMAANYTKTNIMKVGKPNLNWVKAKELSSADVGLNSNIEAITPMLVCVKNCEIDDAGSPFAVTEYVENNEAYTVDHNITLSGGGKLTLNTSTSAIFAADTIPAGKVTIYGVLSRYNDNYQLLMRSTDDIIKQ